MSLPEALVFVGACVGFGIAIAGYCIGTGLAELDTIKLDVSASVSLDHIVTDDRDDDPP